MNGKYVGSASCPLPAVRVGGCVISSARADLPNGVATGDTTLNSSVLWGRSTALGPLSFEYSTDPTFSSVLSIATAVADPLVPVTADISGLIPATRYYYRATDASGASATGTFKTSAAAGVSAGLRFGVAADWRGELRPYPALANVADRNLDLLVERGQVYADVPTADVPAPRNRLPISAASTRKFILPDFGTNTFATVRGSTAVLATIDDHEVIDNWAGGSVAGD